MEDFSDIADLTNDQLLRRIETFSRRFDVAPSRIGRDALRDPGFVFGLKAGRTPRRRTVRRVLDWMKARHLSVQ